MTTNFLKIQAHEPSVLEHSDAREKIFSMLGRALILCFALGGFAYVTADPDLWGHVKYGEDIWHNQSLHKTDPYSYVAFGLPWINHEWLSELAFYGLWAAFLSSGLRVLVAMVYKGKQNRPW